MLAAAAADKPPPCCPVVGVGSSSRLLPTAGSEGMGLPTSAALVAGQTGFGTIQRPPKVKREFLRRRHITPAPTKGAKFTCGCWHPTMLLVGAGVRSRQPYQDATETGKAAIRRVTKRHKRNRCSYARSANQIERSGKVGVGWRRQRTSRCLAAQGVV